MLTNQKIHFSLRAAALIFAALFCLAACAQNHAPAIDAPETPDEAPETPTLSQDERDALLAALSVSEDPQVARLSEYGFLDYLENTYGAEGLSKLFDAAQSAPVDRETLYTLFRATAAVLYDYYHGLPENVRVAESEREGACIRVVGDVSFADNWKILPVLLEKGEGVSGVVSSEALALLREADVTLINNEFTYSTRGEPLAGKAYTFRADPSRVEYMKDLGADLISLANNHAYDYGPDAFADTLQTLRDADLPYIGGGEDETEAAKPYYFIVNGRKYGFSAATRAEKYILTPEATSSSSGVMRTYDPEKYLSVIETVEENCDTNIVYVHWGAEDSHETESVLPPLAEAYIGAGADIVIGAHAHILQGIGYIQNVPVIYNLGNFLFNAETTETGILELQFDSRGAMSARFIPCMQENCTVRVSHGEEAKQVLDLMRSLSPNVLFSISGEISGPAWTIE